MVKTHTKNRLIEIYNAMIEFNGYLNWWPADTPFEVCIGAILTQNTSWNNVEKAILNLKQNNLLLPKRLKDISIDELARLIIPAGYYNIKAKRLKNFIYFLFDKYNGSLGQLFSNINGNIYKLREELLHINGIGKETADSILLYAGNYPIFVVDAYTKRLFARLDILSEDMSYDEIQKFFMDTLSPDARLYNEYHAQIVILTKTFCKKKPLCNSCPLSYKKLCKK